MAPITWAYEWEMNEDASLQNTTFGLKNMTMVLCEWCFHGKQKNVTFIKMVHPPDTAKLELVHSYVYGPTSVGSVGGSPYYVTFINDCTRKVWVYILN